MKRITRRDLLLSSAGAVLLPLGCSRQKAGPEPVPIDPLATVPDKVAMRVVNDRPPCLETPWQYFRNDITPNEAFYVRWHLQSIPADVNLSTWRLRIDGAVERPLELSMADLKRLGSDEVVAVNQCSGNSRSLLMPRVTGAQWKNGAMGNARWGGVSLATLLRKAGIRKDAVQVAFDGLDVGPTPKVPDFIKSLPIERALDPEISVAYSMNNAPLPMLNGYPARLVVPGWYATYWVKSLQTITVLTKPFDGFWMAKAYKLPTTPNGNEDPKQLAKDLVPITRMNVRSFFTTPDADSTIPARYACALDGIAFDGGSGIQKVEVSTDNGKTWLATELGDDLGRFSFRRWRLSWMPPERGSYRLRVRATSRDGSTQPDTVGWNRSGYMRNVVEELSVRVI